MDVKFQTSAKCCWRVFCAVLVCLSACRDDTFSDTVVRGEDSGGVTDNEVCLQAYEALECGELGTPRIIEDFGDHAIIDVDDPSVLTRIGIYGISLNSNIRADYVGYNVSRNGSCAVFCESSCPVSDTVLGCGYNTSSKMCGACGPADELAPVCDELIETCLGIADGDNDAGAEAESDSGGTSESDSDDSGSTETGTEGAESSGSSETGSDGDGVTGPDGDSSSFSERRTRPPVDEVLEFDGNEQVLVTPAVAALYGEFLPHNFTVFGSGVSGAFGEIEASCDGNDCVVSPNLIQRVRQRSNVFIAEDVSFSFVREGDRTAAVLETLNSDSESARLARGLDLRRGDRILRINGETFEDFSELIGKTIELQDAVSVSVDIERDGVVNTRFYHLEPSSGSLFSFDFLEDWSSPVGEISVVQIGERTSLEITTEGYAEINSRAFSSRAEFGGLVSNTLVIDIRRPQNTTIGWAGFMAGHVSCPSANLHNEWFGVADLLQVESDSFESVEVSLSNRIVEALRADAGDCIMQLVLNVGNNFGDYYIDNLRFE